MQNGVNEKFFQFRLDLPYHLSHWHPLYIILLRCWCKMRKNYYTIKKQNSTWCRKTSRANSEWNYLRKKTLPPKRKIFVFHFFFLFFLFREKWRTKNEKSIFFIFGQIWVILREFSAIICFFLIGMLEIKNCLV